MSQVAVITRTKNRPLLLERAINSVLSQTFSDWQMAIVNDGGDINSVEALIEKHRNDFNGRVVTIHNPHSLGMEAASNVGINSTKSNYVVIHDDDDSWRPQFLEKTVDFLQRAAFPNIKGVITHSTRIVEIIKNDNAIKIKTKESFNTWLENVSLYRMAAGNVFPPISFLFQRAVFDKIGLYNESLPVLGDWEFNLRFLRYFDIGVVPELLANYHHRLTINSGDYSNSVIGDNDKHKFFDNLLRNQWLRSDLDNQKVDIGYLMNIAQSFEKVHGQLFPFETVLRKMIQNKVIRRIGKWLTR